MYLSVSELNVETSIPILENTLIIGNTVIFIHSYIDNMSKDFYDSWRRIKNNLSKNKFVNVIDIDQDAIQYIKQYYNNIYVVLSDYVLLFMEYRIPVPSIQIFKNGTKTRFTSPLTYTGVKTFIENKLLGKSNTRLEKVQKEKRIDQKTTPRNEPISKPRNKNIPKRREFALPTYPKLSYKDMIKIEKDVEKAFRRLFKN
jgi:hypothetical protein